MRRVYLDQNKWLDLARAAHGRTGGDRYTAVLDVLRYATERRLASLTLSLAHYFETWKRGDPDSRRRLGEVMYELSKVDTMAGPSSLVPFEIELALHKLFGRPASRPTLRIFGRGVGHAFNQPPVDCIPPLDLPLTADQRAAYRETMIAVLERESILTPPFELPALGIARPDDRFADRYAEAERLSADKLQAEGFSKDLVKRFVFASELVDILDPLKTAMRTHRVSPDELAGEDPLTAFLAAMPTRWMTAHLRRSAFENPSYKWESHDLNDIAYLAVAAVHCDIVVTERKWAHHFGKLAIEVPAKIISDLTLLPELLISP